MFFSLLEYQREWAREICKSKCIRESMSKSVCVRECIRSCHRVCEKVPSHMVTEHMIQCISHSISKTPCQNLIMLEPVSFQMCQLLSSQDFTTNYNIIIH
jgi:hypothetical protein